MTTIAFLKAASLLVSSFLKTTLAVLSADVIGGVLFLLILGAVTKLLSAAADAMRAWKGGEK
ncbi:MAG TPA: hypothetical protein VEC01_05395 [Noviherbaspirillum sp.]|uniref:hypothetical protein n=1 Tax=Noviherbaspirillum sp. TaxID=1926288 RepID=UPI002D269BB5|nr:hypothetical protein [Noviherbaspirillum sp.]HYD94741.1 hypothetical protein [Noviherbaspirillum sp.]